MTRPRAPGILPGGDEGFGRIAAVVRQRARFSGFVLRGALGRPAIPAEKEPCQSVGSVGSVLQLEKASRVSSCLLDRWCPVAARANDRAHTIS